MGTFAIFTLLTISAPNADAQSPQAFFEQKVAPLLATRCFRCHGEDPKKFSGGLRVDSLDALLKGGHEGPALVPGKPAESLVYRAVTYEDPDFEMPPDERLPQAEVDILRRWVEAGAPWPANVKLDAAPTAHQEKQLTDADRNWWAYLPVKAMAPPEVESPRFNRHPIDRFIYRALQANQLKPAEEADRATLARRLAFDLTGLPPKKEAVAAFVSDNSPQAYERFVDALMASPHYGEHWARRWMDLVRYAESDGHRQDAYRAQAWPYRDYLIRSFNADKPYDRFVSEQLAGDELASEDPDAMVATGFLRLGTYEFNQRDVRRQWQDILNEVTDVTADVFMATGLACARCHDHKFDPLLQRDYYRLQAFFAPMTWPEAQPVASADQHRSYRERLALWEAETKPLREAIETLEQPFRLKARETALARFSPELRAIYEKPAATRTPLETQLSDLIDRQVQYELSRFEGGIKGDVRIRWSQLRQELDRFAHLRPAPPLQALVAKDVGAEAPPTLIPGDRTATDVAPGFVSVLDDRNNIEIPKPKARQSTGRRLALARWLTDASNPLTARVMVNRIWQRFFGRGLVASASDFGRLGEPPSHPELLDYLAHKFVQGGWRIKPIERLILTSQTYRMAVHHPAPAQAMLRDPQNLLLWRAPLRRLQAEQIRDALWATSGELDWRVGGESVDAKEPRRSVYTKVLRNTREPLLDVFDAPDGFISAASRNVTTTAAQALQMINGGWTLARALATANRVEQQVASFAAPPKDRDAAIVGAAFTTILGRPPTAWEAKQARLALTHSRRAARLAPSDGRLDATMPHRGGRAVRMRRERIDDWLTLKAQPPQVQGAGFSVEAVALLETIESKDGVRVLASQPAANDAPGWQLSVHGRGALPGGQSLQLKVTNTDGTSAIVESDLVVELNKTHHVAVSVQGQGESGSVTFYVRDLTDAEAPLKTVTLKHSLPEALRLGTGMVIGGSGKQAKTGWDGLIDEVRFASAVDERSLLLQEAAPAHVYGHFRFELRPGFYADSSQQKLKLERLVAPVATQAEAAVVDLCHGLLNTNEFLYLD